MEELARRAQQATDLEEASDIALARNMTRDDDAVYTLTVPDDRRNAQRECLAHAAHHEMLQRNEDERVAITI